ncbi:MAG: peptide deformylase [Armatimonadetes bacterium RBG_16_58_9]|nr:MAG: peptide deformylase [Armatimonadetes bacterium RBG_16_58_9]
MEVTETAVMYGNEVLRKRADEIEGFNNETRQLIEKMWRIMADANGLGLAGPQIGLSNRVFVYDVGDGQHAMINPEMISSSGEESAVEGCLSIPGLQGEVTRSASITITGIDEEGKRVSIEATGLLARVFQHEIDHLDGTMFVDRADPDTLKTIPLDREDETDKI